MVYMGYSLYENNSHTKHYIYQHMYESNSVLKPSETEVGIEFRYTIHIPLTIERNATTIIKNFTTYNNLIHYMPCLSYKRQCEKKTNTHSGIRL